MQYQCQVMYSASYVYVIQCELEYKRTNFNFNVQNMHLYTLYYALLCESYKIKVIYMIIYTH